MKKTSEEGEITQATFYRTWRNICSRQSVGSWPQQKSRMGLKFWCIPVDSARHFFICAPECFAESWQSFSKEQVLTFAPSGDKPHKIAVREKLFFIRYPTDTWPGSNAAGQLSGFIQPAERSVFAVTCPRASVCWLFDLIEGFVPAFRKMMQARRWSLALILADLLRYDKRFISLCCYK